MPEAIDDVAESLPGEALENPIRGVINPCGRDTITLEVCQWMGECSRATPGHGEHQMERNSECLRAVYVCKTRRIGNDSISHKRLLGLRIGLDTRVPAAIQHIPDHFCFALDVSFSNTVH